MKTLLKAMETEEDLTRFMNFCEAHGIDTIARNGNSLSLDMINFENGSINWGGYGSGFSVGSHLFGYFKLVYPGGDPPRGKSFANVKMVISGRLSDLDVDEVTAKVEAEGGLVVSAVDKTVNLLVVGTQPNAKLVKKAEGLGQVVTLDEKRFASLLPAPRKASKKRKPSKPTPATVDKKALTNLKKLLVSRDIDRVLQGVELMRSLEDVEIYNYFLDGVTTDVDGSPVPNATFKGTGPAQAFLNVALLGVIAHAPEECEVASALRKSVTNLTMELASTETLSAFPNLKSLNLSGSKELKNLDGLPESKKLKSVDLSECEALENVDGLSGTTALSKVDFLECRALQNVDGLANNAKLTRVNLEMCRSLENIDGLSNGANLTHAHFNYCESLINVDGLSQSTKLTKVDFEDCSSLENIDGLSRCTKLTGLSFQGCSSLENVDGLAKLTQLKSLDLYGCWGLQNLDGLKQCKSIGDLKLSYSLSHVDGISHLKGLTEIELSECDELDNLKGLAGCPKLERLVVGSEALENVDDLAQCKNLTHLSLEYCGAIKNVDGLAKCTKLTSLALANCGELQNVDGLLKCTNLTELSLESCSALGNLDGLVNLTKLKVQGWQSYFDLDGCDALRDVGGLAGCKKITELNLGNSVREVLPSGLDKLTGLKTLYLTYSSKLKHVDPLAGCAKLVSVRLNECQSLENVAGLLGCAKLSELDLGGSKKVSPKPAKLGMFSRSEVAAYLARVEKEFAPSASDAASNEGSKKAGKSKKSAKKKASKKKR